LIQKTLELYSFN